MIMNVWLRQLSTQLLSAMVNTKYPGLGLFILAIIYLLLTGALGLFGPYNDRRISLWEGSMMTFFFLICGSAGLGSLLGEHRQQINEGAYDSVIGFCGVVTVLCTVLLALELGTTVFYVSITRTLAFGRIMRGKKLKNRFDSYMRVPKESLLGRERGSWLIVSRLRETRR